MKTTHNTLTSAMLSVEDLVSQGHASFKLYKEQGSWWVIVNNIVNGESK